MLHDLNCTICLSTPDVADGTLSMTHGPRRLGRYSNQGTPMAAT